MVATLQQGATAQHVDQVAVPHGTWQLPPLVPATKPWGGRALQCRMVKIALENGESSWLVVMLGKCFNGEFMMLENGSEGFVNDP